MRDEDVDAERRREQSDREVHREDDAEMHAINADRLDDRHEQGAKQQDRRQRIEEAADDEQQHVDREQQHPRLDLQRG